MAFQWSAKKKILVSCSIGWILTILGAIMIPLMKYIIKRKVQDTVIIKEGGEVYEYWQDPPVPIYMQFYMFNISNPKEFMQGQKPAVVQHGPYTYSERRIKFNISWNSNGTVTYRQNRLFHFLPDKSSGNESDMFITPNPVYWTLFNAMKYESPEVRKILATGADLLDEHVLMTRSMKDIIWGYSDIMLRLARTLDPDWFYTDVIGYFMNKNNTNDGVYTVFTGAKDIMKLGIINRYNGTSHLNFWTTKWANMINGSDGTLGPPYLPKSEALSSFVSDVCRSVMGHVVKDVTTKQGIPLWRYQAPNSYLANATENPDNIGFCTPQSKCLGSGIYNASVCQLVDFFNVPAAFSFPHFYLADPKYINAVVGLSPNKEEHETYIDLEPYTGLVLQAAKRLQGNIYVMPVENVSETKNLKPMFVPVFWINESVSIDDHNANKLKRLLFTPLEIIHVAEITIIALGIAIVLGTILVALACRVRSNYKINVQLSRGEVCNRGTDEEETKPLIRHGVRSYSGESSARQPSES